MSQRQSRFSVNRGDIVIWAILLLLGVPLWVCATGILVLVLRNRSLRKRAADIPMRLRIDAKGRWHRGHGLWVHDVLGFRGSPAALRDKYSEPRLEAAFIRCIRDRAAEPA